MKTILFSLLLLAATTFSRAQTYTFSHFNETYQVFSDGTLMDFDSICGYEELPPSAPIGFQMPYFGYFMSTIRVDQSFLMTDNLSTVPGEDVIAQMFALSANYSLVPYPTSAVRYKTEGVSGSKIFKLQFEDLRIENDSVGNDRCNYQVWMYEANGRIEVRTGPYQISQEDGYFSGELGVMSGLALLDLVNEEIFPGVIFLMDDANYPSAFYNATAEFAPTVIGHPSDGMVYRFDKTILSVENLQDLNSYEIYPNPATSIIELKGDFSAETSVKVYDLKNQLLGTYTDSKINIEALSSGIYMVVLTNSNGSVTKKFVKN